MDRLRRSIFAAGLALAVLAMLACAPTISRLLPAHGQGWIEICTAEGLRDVALPSGDLGSDPAKAPTHRHDIGEVCAYCALQAHSPLLFAALPLVAMVGVASHPTGAVDATSSAHRRFVASAQARAPPSAA